MSAVSELRRLLEDAQAQLAAGDAVAAQALLEQASALCASEPQLNPAELEATRAAFARCQAAAASLRNRLTGALTDAGAARRADRAYRP